MRIDSHFNNYDGRHRMPNFTATPAQILDKLEYARICPGKKAYLENLATFFDKLEDKMLKSSKLPERFDYFLKRDNDIPQNLEKAKVRTGFLSWTSFKSIDQELNESSFSCGSDSHCTCGRGKSLKEYTSELLEYIGVPEPDKISLGKY